MTDDDRPAAGRRAGSGGSDRRAGDLAGRLRACKALVLDKDGVWVDVHRTWGAIATARARAIARALARPDWEAPLLAAFGLVDGRVAPEGALAGSSRAEAQALACRWLMDRDVPGPVAREAAETGFAEGDRARAGAIAAVPGALDALRALHQAGFRLAVATTDTTAGSRADAAALGVAELFAIHVGADAPCPGKPAPDPCLAACKALGLSPGEVAVVGDGVGDLLMARAAGVAVAVGVRSGAGTDEHLGPHADLLVDGLGDLLAWLAPAQFMPGRNASAHSGA